MAKPVNAADGLIVPVAADPPETVVPRLVVSPYSNFGVVDVVPATIVPLNVAVVVPTADGLFVVTETAAELASTLDAVQPPVGRSPASSFAA